MGGDIVGRIYEYFISKLAPVWVSDDGVFFIPKSLVQMIVNILDRKRGTLLEFKMGVNNNSGNIGFLYKEKLFNERVRLS